MIVLGDEHAPLRVREAMWSAREATVQPLPSLSPLFGPTYLLLLCGFLATVQSAVKREE